MKQINAWFIRVCFYHDRNNSLRYVMVLVISVTSKNKSDPPYFNPIDVARICGYFS